MPMRGRDRTGTVWACDGGLAPQSFDCGMGGPSWKHILLKTFLTHAA